MTVFEHFQANAKEFDAFFCKTCPISLDDTHSEKFTKIQTFIKKHNLHYPLILKPDDGVGGMGLQFIKDEKSLRTALKLIKKNYVLQEYVHRPLELSVFFIKQPGEKGRIRSITRRYTIKHDNEPELMMPTRRIICKDESHLITPMLERTFNAISDIPGFHFGRFDIRAEDLQTFTSKGTGFRIIEVNVGAHSIALHAFDNRYGRAQRYKILFNQIKFAFDIAMENKHISLYPEQNFKEFLQGFLRIFKNADK